MKNNPLNTNNKHNLKSLILILLIIISSVSSGCSKYDPSKFEENINAQNYDTAFEYYSVIEQDYQKSLSSLENYLNNLIASYNNSNTTYDETLKVIDDLSGAGFNGELMDNYIDKLKTLQASKESFSNGNMLYVDYGLREAKEFLLDVVEWDTLYADAVQTISQIDELLTDNEEMYLKADELYLKNHLDSAYTTYRDIVTSQINIDTAQSMMVSIDDINASWNMEFSENSAPKSTYPYEAASKDDFMYIPYSYKNNHGILKYNTQTKETEFLMIANMPGAFIIKDINTVGEYLYFIAGENVGNGKQIDNPYNVYRMKNDGTKLDCISLGDYKNLIAYKNGFYVCSYSNGVQQTGRDFEITEQIASEPALQMQLIDDILYYTLDTHTPDKNVYAEYSYNGHETSEIWRNLYLGFAAYKDVQFLTRREGDNYFEVLTISPTGQKPEKIVMFADFAGVYGLLDDQIVCAMERSNGFVEHYLLDTQTSEMVKYQKRLPDNVISLKNVHYADKTLIFSTDNGFLITDKEYNPVDTIDFSQVDFANLSLCENTDFVHTDEEFYTEDEVVVIEDNFWYYSNPQYNIRIEERYNENFDTNIFVAHIRTTNLDCFNIGAPFPSAYLTHTRKYPIPLARQYSAVFACNGDFFDQNAWTGISIRNGTVYKDRLQVDMAAIYPDGRMVCYSHEDKITADELLDAGVKNTFSFGPILLSEGIYGDHLYDHFLQMPNPRNAVGMVEPGHYVFILCDGREPKSAGLTLRSMADLFLEEGCTEAYNLDGGLSSIMLFMGEPINSHINDYNHKEYRTLPEIVYFAASDLVAEE